MFNAQRSMLNVQHRTSNNHAHERDRELLSLPAPCSMLRATLHLFHASTMSGVRRFRSLHPESSMDQDYDYERKRDIDHKTRGARVREREAIESARPSVDLTF
jgi:hypothetical protein